MNRRIVLKSTIGLAGTAAIGSSAVAAFQHLFSTEPPSQPGPLTPILAGLTSPVLFGGDASTAYRDPAAYYHQGWFYLYFTLIKTESNRIPYSYLAWSKSQDLRHWTTPITLTPRNKHLDYGSPGDVIQIGTSSKPEWLLCVQTYPRPNGERYGTKDARIWTIRSSDLQHWSTPELLHVKGPAIRPEAMGRMIDPYLIRDKDDPARWWCFYKQNGISMSYSTDLTNWTYAGRTDAGENPCVIVDNHQYILIHSPKNGIGIKRSVDLHTWHDEGTITLNQKKWPWAQGRITAAFVLDLRTTPQIGKALMFFHGSRYAEEDTRGGFDNYASIGIAWSNSLTTSNWYWPPELKSIV